MFPDFFFFFLSYATRALHSCNFCILCRPLPLAGRSFLEGRVISAFPTAVFCSSLMCCAASRCRCSGREGRLLLVLLQGCGTAGDLPRLSLLAMPCTDRLAQPCCSQTFPPCAGWKAALARGIWERSSPASAAPHPAPRKGLLPCWANPAFSDEFIGFQHILLWYSMLFSLLNTALPAVPNITEKRKQYLRSPPFSVQKLWWERQYLHCTLAASRRLFSGLAILLLKWFEVEQNAFVLRTAEGF